MARLWDLMVSVWEVMVSFMGLRWDSMASFMRFYGEFNGTFIGCHGDFIGISPIKQGIWMSFYDLFGDE